MKPVLAVIPLTFLLGAVACGGSEPVAEDANNTAGLGTVVAEANATAEAVHERADETPPAPGGNDTGQTQTPPTPGAVIPAQFHGRWGMVPADCTSTRGDAKGLITVGDTSIRFYESTATLMDQRAAGGNRFSGRFAFTGEGQRWEKVMTFTRNGGTLLRAEQDGRFTYKRCA